MLTDRLQSLLVKRSTLAFSLGVVRGARPGRQGRVSRPREIMRIFVRNCAHLADARLGWVGNKNRDDEGFEWVKVEDVRKH